MEIKKRRSFWIFCLIWSCCKGKEPVQIVQVSTVSRSECATWGNFHFHTFDHVKFTFPGTCTYVFASHCNDSYQDFNIQIRRSDKNSFLIYFTVTIDGVILEVKETGITVNGNKIYMPFSLKSILIEDTCTYFQVTSKLGLTLKWNWADTLLLDLEETYKEKICGLCGNYDGSEKNDLVLDGYKMHPRQFGNFHKVEDPSEKCADVRPDDHTGRHPRRNDDRCSKYKKRCKKLMSRFGNCPRVVAFDDYVETCTEDMCHCAVNSSHSDLVSSCICSTLNQYSRDCVLRKGDPGEWRTKELCYQECPNNMEYMECGNSCADTCADPERSKICKAPCTDGCFCPPGTILDDLGGKKCIPRDSCPCMFQGKVYSSGGMYSTPCQNCTCKGGHWSCISLPCSGSCSIDGGFHITTFDNKRFNFHGNCHYVLAKNTDDTFVVIGEIIQCGTSKTMTCLKNVLVTLGRTTIKICSCGNIYMNNFIVKLPISKDGITIFRPSTFFIKILSSTGVQIRVQIKPVMQLSITVDHSYQNRTSGLCGNFNNIQTDDFRTVTGAVEDSASAFGNSWKTRAGCFDVEDNFEDPCSNSMDKEKFAQHWCALLSNTSSVFAACHSVVEPSVYIKKCMYDTCNAEKSEVALCSVLSTYSRDCAAAGMSLKGWRQGICDPSEECPETMVYNYSVKYCNQSCRSLDEPDPLCKVQIAPMEGCGCPEGTYLNDEEECVTPDDCPCYYKGKIVQPGNSFQEDKLMCKCIQGRLDCIGETVLVKDCPAPMYYFNCSSAGPGAIGSECQKSCKTQDMHCYVTECVSGCMCPDGLVLDGSGGCIPKDQCPCVHGGHFYKPGETIKVDCNTCTCNRRQWNCTDNPCKGTCTVYGNGHYMSFDGEKFDFLGDCDYILAQDFCPNNMDAGTFRIVIQNNACGKSLSICSLKITLIFESSEIRLLEGRIQEIATDPGAEKNYKVDLRGGYIVIETNQGMNFMWDQKTTVVVHVAPSFQGKVCGLCGDFDGRSRNDFTTRGQSMEMSIQEFGNSWKITSTCSNINMTDLCADQPFKSALGHKHCSIIKSNIFEACHSKVNPIPYYESCISDFCGCDSVGDCECFCTSVAAYSRSCSRAGVCIDWRTPAICPVFCDYYNPPDKHEWFYKPCGASCLKTCRNPQGKCGNLLYSLEGCYPECSPDKPYFDEKSRECVSFDNCTSCVTCYHDICSLGASDCLCCYNGKTYTLNETVYSQVHGTECSDAVCGPDGEIIKTLIPCSIPSTLAQEPHMQPVTSASPSSVVATPCFCNDNGQLMQIGENISLPVNVSGHCAYSICNSSCQIELIWAECKTGHTEAPKICDPDSEACPPTSAPSATSRVPASTGTPVSDCLGLIPPRKFNETWNFGNCQIATCLGEGNNIKLSSMTCPPQQLKLCVNGFPFTKHYDETGCCEVFECQCICSGWGNEHYVTFDGTYYHFKENCTYVLVKSIHPDSHIFWIHIDNYYCGATDGAICSMSLLIFHSNSVVILTQAMEHGKETNLILFNDKKVVPDIFKNGIRITSSGLYIIVEIPQLDVYVSYSRLAFYIKLPFGKFFNNTMGLCGTCTNEKSDDAVKRNSEVIESFKEMALDWKVPDPTNRYCNPGVSEPAEIEYHQHCEPSNLCKIIWNLTECHGVVPPQPYYEACVASGCSEQHPSTECQSMQTYAALCGLHGVCVDWRRQASGQCEASCAQDQVYKPCGQAKRSTCFSREVIMDTVPSQTNTPVFVEGCYCPDGKILLNEHDGICVSVCGCTAQDGSVKRPREAWEHDCQYCACDEVTLNISCFPRPCAKSPPINCTKEGFVRKIKTRLDDPCCTETVCECDIKTCIINKTACDLGFQPVVGISEDGCCPIFSCIPKGVCVSEGVEFKPGAMVPKSSCEDCVCTDEQDIVTRTNRIQCVPVKCQTTCQQGFHYVEEEGQCCSQCQQVACVANFPFGSVTIEVGKSYKAPYDNCTQYTCTESAGQFSLTSTVKVCLPFEESNCVPGTVDVTSDGCCKTCIDLPHKCKRSLKEQYIIHNNCKSAAPVPVPFCEGTCSTYSVYSFEASEMEHKCICCREKRSHEVKVELVCSEHKTVQFTYVHVDECGCMETKCPKRRT
ncbi:MUC5B protein, partial [Haliaeetus albicilla]|nr:MUC5B protein [Haliaeetus albicilla]